MSGGITAQKDPSPAVGSQIELHMDGGIRPGRDVLKAAALGAKGTACRDRTAINTVGKGIQLPGTFEPAQRPQRPTSTCISVGSSEPMNDSTAAV